MKPFVRRATFFAIALLLVGFHVALVNGQSILTPQIACDEPRFDFGRKSGSGSGAKVSHTFFIRNTGTTSLQITNVRPPVGCDCGASEKIGEKIVMPGTNTSISIEWSLSFERGAVKREWWVESNDPKTPQLLLTMSGNVAEDVEIRPIAVDFGEVAPAFSGEQLVEVTTQTNVFLQVTNVVCSLPQFTAATERLDCHHYRLHVKAHPPFAHGVTQGDIRIFTDNPDCGELQLLARLKVPMKIIVAPEEISFDSSASGLQQWTVVIASKDARAFKILEIKVPDPNIKASYSAIGTDGYRISFATTGVVRRLEEKSITIATDHPEAENIFVPIRVR